MIKLLSWSSVYNLLDIVGRELLYKGGREYAGEGLGQYNAVCAYMLILVPIYLLMKSVALLRTLCTTSGSS